MEPREVWVKLRNSTKDPFTVEIKKPNADIDDLKKAIKAEKKVEVEYVYWEDGHQNITTGRQALEKAVACGLEISVSCGRYEVRLDGSAIPESRQSSGLLGRFLPNFSLPSFLTPSTKIIPTQTDNNDSVAYLDVHAGVSLGLMAGVDIGHNNRWEYFLIGEPLSRVAECESEAEKGDVVICKKAHSLLHDRSTSSDGISNRKKDEEVVTIKSRRLNNATAHQTHGHGNTNQQGNMSKLPCGCFTTKSGLYCVSKLDTQIPNSSRNKVRRSRSKSKLEEDYIHGELNAQLLKINEEIQADLEKVFNNHSTQNYFKRGFTNAVLGSATRDQLNDGSLANQDMENSLSNSMENI